MLGIVVNNIEHSEIDSEKLRKISAVLDTEPVIPELLLQTLLWVARYYQQPIGEVLSTALPLVIRQGRPQVPKFDVMYKLSREGLETQADSLGRARVQKQVFEFLTTKKTALNATEMNQLERSWKNAIKELRTKGLVEVVPVDHVSDIGEMHLIEDLTEQQKQAKDQVLSSLDEYRCHLLHGVTGSGKTEVYLHIIAKVLEHGGQALLLVPEIGLSPQLEQRVQYALGVAVSSFHSGLTNAQRHKAWWLASSGKARVVIGTRSAVFLPFQNLKLIVIDEEHDSSFKQQERVRYHARSVALHRASTIGIPIILGTATPSLESIHAARQNRAHTLMLPHRATDVEMPKVRLIDLTHAATVDGVSVTLIEQIKNRIMAGEQSLIFINRRGYAPVVVCIGCRWTAVCESCDSRLIYHQSDHRLHCHLCMKRISFSNQCPECQTDSVRLFGVGTQRVEQALQRAISGVRVMRIDRDTTRSYAEFERKLHRIHEGKVDILIGTQMLSKGHHFPRVTLAGILNVDQGFYSMDFRAMEYLVQQVVQVAGRSGRVEKPGDVYIQTMHPESEYFDSIRKHDYLKFADLELQSRKQAGQPPYSHYVLLRANSISAGEEIKFLVQAREHAQAILRGQNASEVLVFDIVQSPIKFVSNRFRAQLLVGSRNTRMLNRFLNAWWPLLDGIPKRGKLRWSLDVDPIDFS